MEPKEAVQLLEAVADAASRWDGDQTWSGLPAHQLRQVIGQMKRICSSGGSEEAPEVVEASEPDNPIRGSW